MVSFLPLLVLLSGAAPDASPPPPAPAPLQEIGRVRALSPCSAIVVHANQAISRTLDNDRALSVLSTTLRRVDLDTEENPAKRRRAVDASPDPARKLELNAPDEHGTPGNLGGVMHTTAATHRASRRKCSSGATSGIRRCAPPPRC